VLQMVLDNEIRDSMTDHHHCASRRPFVGSLITRNQ
jgi:hypothetical protein